MPRRILPNRVVELLSKKDFVKITYYVQRADYQGIMDASKFLYDQGAIPRPTAGTYSRAAAFMLYKELATRSAKVQREIPRGKLKAITGNCTFTKMD